MERSCHSLCTKKIPMELLIREFNHYYNISISKGISDKDCEAFVEKGDELIHFPDEVMANILSKMSVTEVLTSWSISHHWAAVCASQQFMNGKTEKFIVINNSNLDMWAFSIASKRWLLLNMPCDWEKLGMKTLGVKATCDGLFLVARSDFNLFVVNPVKSQVISLPTILPHTEDRLKFLESLIVDGTAEMLVNRVTRDFELYLFGNCEAAGESCVHLAQYSSTTTVWTVQPILLHGVPLSSTLFPSPLRSYRRINIVRRINIFTCISSTFKSFDYPYRNRNHVKVDGKSFLNIPGTIDLKNNGGALPIMVPFNDGAGDYGFIWVGRLKGDESGKGMFGKLPIVPHFSLGIWKFSERQWEMIDTIKAELIEDMIKSSEGTDFLVVGDGRDTIWLMLRGSESMVEYNTRTKESLMLPGCPGGGYMDTNFHWKALIAQFRF